MDARPARAPIGKAAPCNLRLACPVLPSCLEIEILRGWGPEERKPPRRPGPGAGPSTRHATDARSGEDAPAAMADHTLYSTVLYACCSAVRICSTHLFRVHLRHDSAAGEAACCCFSLALADPSAAAGACDASIRCQSVDPGVAWSRPGHRAMNETDDHSTVYCINNGTCHTVTEYSVPACSSVAEVWRRPYASTQLGAQTVNLRWRCQLEEGRRQKEKRSLTPSAEVVISISEARTPSLSHPPSLAFPIRPSLHSTSPFGILSSALQ